LKFPPTADQLKEILAQLGFVPRHLMRQNKDIYADCELNNPSLTDAQLINFMVKHSILIQRPILIANGKASIGRPPEQVFKILSTLLFLYRLSQVFHFFEHRKQGEFC
jgi:arsenate reductase (glutaredoxin)